MDREVVIHLRLDNQDQVRNLGKLKVELDQVRASMKLLKSITDENGRATKTQERQYGELEARAKNLRSRITELGNSISGVTSASLRFRDKMAEASRAGLSAFGLNIIGVTAAVGSMVAVLRNAGKTIIGFQQSQANLASILGKSRKEIGALTDSALRLGPALGRLPKEVTDLQTELAKLGFTEDEILDAQAAVIQLANATGEDLAKSAEVAAATVRGFGLTAADTQRVVDVMAQSFNATALDLEKFSTSIAIVAPVAKLAGQSIEETTAQVGLLANRGVDASTIGSSLRNIFLELAKRGLTLNEALEKIATSTNKNGTALELFGKRSATVALILAENREELTGLESSLNSAGGAAQKMANEQLNTLSGALKRLSGAWDAFIISIENGEGAIGSFFKGAIETVTGFLDALTTDEAEKRVDSFMENVKKNIEESGIEAGDTFWERVVGNDSARTKFIKSAANALEGIAKSSLEDLQSFLNVSIEQLNIRRANMASQMLNSKELEQMQFENVVIEEQIKQVKQLIVAKKLHAIETGSNSGAISEETDSLEDNTDALKKQKKAADDAFEALLRQNEERKKLLEQPQDVTPQDPLNLTIQTDDTGDVDGVARFREIMEQRKRIAQETADAFIDLEHAKLEAAGDFVSGLSSLAKEGSEAQKALFAFEKAFAIGDVIIRLQQETAAISATNAILGPAGIPITAVQTQAAAIRAAARIGTIVAQTIGSIGGFYEGGFTSRRSSDHVPVGVVHANEWVASAPTVRKFRPVIDMMEEYQRGRASAPRISDGFLTGGHVHGTALVNIAPEQIISIEQLAENRATEFSAQVAVTEINEVQNRVAVREQRATLG